MRSIFTSDMNKCAVTNIYRGSRRIEIHHVFGSANRSRSTEYGFVVPLVDVIHPNGAAADEKECKRLTGMTLKELDTNLKKRCQEYYENRLGKAREQFIAEFGRNYLD